MRRVHLFARLHRHPRRPGLSLGAEPALPLWGVHPIPAVRLPARNVVDVCPLAADVPLDMSRLTRTAIGLTTRLQPLSVTAYMEPFRVRLNGATAALLS